MMECPFCESEMPDFESNLTYVGIEKINDSAYREICQGICPDCGKKVNHVEIYTYSHWYMEPGEE